MKNLRKKINKNTGRKAEKNNLEKVCNREKEKGKASQELECQLRVELLKIKSEKNVLISNNKSLEIRVDELERQCYKKENVIKDFETQLKSKMKLLANLERRVDD